MEDHTVSPASNRRCVSRRTFLRAAGAAGVTTGLAGCIARGNDEGPNTVQWAADADAADNADAIQEALWRSGLSRDIEVEILPGSAESDVRQSQYTRWLSANLPEPDILSMDSGWALPFIVRRQVLNLSENLPGRLVDRVKNDYFQASVDTATAQNGDLYAVPLFPDFPTMQYRKDLVKDAGFDPDGENWATESIPWKRFSEVTKKAQQENDLDMGFTFQADIYEGLPCCDFNEFMSSFGGAYFGGLDNLFGPIGERPVTVAEKPVLDSIRMIRTFIHGENDPHALDGYAGNISPRTVLTWTEETSRAPFTNGRAVMHRNWPYSIIINGAEDAFGEDLGVMPIPYGVPANEAQYEGTGGPTAALGGWHVTVNPNTEKMDAALQVVEAMMGEEFMLTVFERIGWTPPDPAILESDQAKEIPILGRYVDALRVAGENAIPRPVTVVWPQEAGKIAQQVHSTYSGGTSPERAMQTLQNQLQEIEEYNR